MCRCSARRRSRRWSARTWRSGAAATVLTALVDRPDGYGRIVRDDGRIAAIVEHKDASPTEREIGEINSGIYAFDLAPLFAALRCDRVGERAGRVLPCPIWSGSTASRGLTVETVTLDGLARDPGREQPEGAGRRGGNPEDDEN